MCIFHAIECTYTDCNVTLQWREEIVNTNQVLLFSWSAVPEVAEPASLGDPSFHLCLHQFELDSQVHQDKLCPLVIPERHWGLSGSYVSQSVGSQLRLNCSQLAEPRKNYYLEQEQWRLLGHPLYSQVILEQPLSTASSTTSSLLTN